MDDVVETVRGGDDFLNCGRGDDFADGGPGTDESKGCESTVNVEDVDDSDPGIAVTDEPVHFSLPSDEVPGTASSTETWESTGRAAAKHS